VYGQDLAHGAEHETVSLLVHRRVFMASSRSGCLRPGRWLHDAAFVSMIIEIGQISALIFELLCLEVSEKV
jgi:hypothetical protein